MTSSITDKVLSKIQMIIARLKNQELNSLSNYSGATISGQEASDLIRTMLSSNEPCMVARFGSTELNIVTEYVNSKLGVKKYWLFMNGQIDSYKFREKSMSSAHLISGIFPEHIRTFSKFSELTLNDMGEVDVLGSWRQQEQYYDSQLAQAQKVRLPDLEPYYHQNPWSSCLKGKKVLVVHPFTNTIQSQYEKRNFLFENPQILPEFELSTIKSVQSLAGEKVEFKDWFEALDSMKEKINQVDFDIAIIGCGAYGFPLAAHIKRIGKKAVHLGGATQLLFGIKGARWENHPKISKLFNEHWVHPSKEETPDRHKIVEGGSYW